MMAEKEPKPAPGLTAWDQLRSVFAAHGAIGDEFAEMMNEIEAQRKRDFGRPPPDFE